MKTHEIRERFTQHFVNSGHEAVPSASLILDDPNLLFVNAGMVPFSLTSWASRTHRFRTV